MEVWNGDGETQCDTCGWPEQMPDQALKVLQENTDEVCRNMGVDNRGPSRCRARLDKKDLLTARVKIPESVSKSGRGPEFIRRLHKSCGGVWKMQLNNSSSYVKVEF